MNPKKHRRSKNDFLAVHIHPFFGCKIASMRRVRTVSTNAWGGVDQVGRSEERLGWRCSDPRCCCHRGARAVVAGAAAGPYGPKREFELDRCEMRSYLVRTSHY
jgi:hypothetical protein